MKFDLKHLTLASILILMPLGAMAGGGLHRAPHPMPTLMLGDDEMRPYVFRIGRIYPCARTSIVMKLTSASALARIALLHKQHANIGVLFVAVGRWDLYQQSISVSDYESNLEALVLAAKSAWPDVTVVLATPTDVPAGAVGRAETDPPLYAAAMKTAATNTGADVADLETAMIPYAADHRLSGDTSLYDSTGIAILAVTAVDALQSAEACTLRPT